MIAKERLYAINAKGVKYSIDLSYYNTEVSKNVLHIITANNKHLCIDDSARSTDKESLESFDIIFPSGHDSLILDRSHCNYIYTWIYYTCIFEGKAGSQYVAGSYTNRAIIKITQPPEGIKFRFDEVHSGSSYLNYTRTTYYTPSGVTNRNFTYNTSAEKHPNTNIPSDITVTIKVYYRFNDSNPWVMVPNPWVMVPNTGTSSIKMSYNSTKEFTSYCLNRRDFNF